MSLVDGTKQRAFDPPSVLIQSEETEKVNAEGNRGPGIDQPTQSLTKQLRHATLTTYLLFPSREGEQFSGERQPLSMTFACEAPVYLTGVYSAIEQLNQLFAQGHTMPFFRGFSELRS